MSLFNQSYRAFCNRLDRFRSSLKIMHFRMKYPSLKIKFNSYLAKNVEIICCDGSRCEITNTHIAKGVYIKVEENAILKVDNSYIGADSMIVANKHIEIHSHCSIGEMVVIRDQNHIFGNQKLVKDSGYEIAPVIIRENVWLGAKSTILKGVELGENTVVGAHSLVNKSFPANSILIGSPAKLMIKK